MQIRVVLPPSALMLFALSCGTQGTSINVKNISSEQIHKIVLANQLQMQSVKGEGTISVETPSIAQSGAFSLALRKPDSILVKLRGPFGIKIGSALLTREEFTFYSSLENRLFTGETNPKNLAKVLRLNLDFDDLLNLFTGGVFLKEDQQTPDVTTTEDDQLCLLYRKAEETHKYLIDPQSLMITKIQDLDLEGKLIFEQRFTGFQNLAGTVVPFNIRIVQPKERRMVSVTYSDLILNTQELEFGFTYPKNAERIRWQ